MMKCSINFLGWFIKKTLYIVNITDVTKTFATHILNTEVLKHGALFCNNHISQNSTNLSDAKRSEWMD